MGVAVGLHRCQIITQGRQQEEEVIERQRGKQHVTQIYAQRGSPSVPPMEEKMGDSLCVGRADGETQSDSARLITDHLLVSICSNRLSAIICSLASPSFSLEKFDTFSSLPSRVTLSNGEGVTGVYILALGLLNQVVELHHVQYP